MRRTARWSFPIGNQSGRPSVQTRLTEAELEELFEILGWGP